MEKNIAFFDFDGTITRRDTMIEFIKYAKGIAAYYMGIAIISPYIAAMKAGFIPASRAKEKLLSRFFNGMHIDDFNNLCKRFSEERMTALIRRDAMEAILKHQMKGDEVVIVSASAENWICFWCDKMGLKYIGTRLKIDENKKITGELDGDNCNGQEKVNRIILSYNPAAYNNIYCYGDTAGDAFMLKLATHPHYRHFHE